MKKAKNLFGVWVGVIMAVAGLILLYLGYDFEHTNLNTFDNPELIKAAPLYIGFVLVGLGILTSLVNYFFSTKK